MDYAASAMHELAQQMAVTVHGSGQEAGAAGILLTTAAGCSQRRRQLLSGLPVISGLYSS